MFHCLKNKLSKKFVQTDFPNEEHDTERITFGQDI